KSVAEQLDWLTYRHWGCFENPRPRTEMSLVILDNDSYNPHESRELHGVTDFTLSFHASVGPGQFAVALDTAFDRFVFQRSEPSGEWQCKQNDKRIASGTARSFILDHDHEWEFSLCDQTVSFCLDGTEIIRASFTPTRRGRSCLNDWPPLCAIGAAET